jgi:hypothetical protein
MTRRTAPERPDQMTKYLTTENLALPAAVAILVAVGVSDTVAGMLVRHLPEIAMAVGSHILRAAGF